MFALTATRLAADEIARVQKPLDDATPLPKRAFTEEGIFRFERRAILDRAWTIVAREDDLRRPGDFVVAPLGPAGVMVVRGVDLELRAFVNVCLHRAMPLACGKGNADRLVCPYHGWIYDTRGALVAAPRTSDRVVEAGRRLEELRTATWRGFVLVCAASEAPSLEDALGTVPPWLVRAPLELLRRVHAAEHVAHANWKLVVANFQESHHFARVHPSLEALTPSSRASSWGARGPWLGGTMPILPPAETVSSTGRIGARKLVGEPGLVRDAMLFPTLLTSLQPDYLLAYRLFPEEVATTRVLFEIYVHPASESGDHRDVVELWTTTNDEDRRVVEAQQRGMESNGPEPLCYARCEDGVHAFERLVARAHAEAE